MAQPGDLPAVAIVNQNGYGIFLQLGDTVVNIVSSTIRDNIGGVVAANEAGAVALVLTNSAVSDNADVEGVGGFIGGGVRFEAPQGAASMTITGSSITGNVARYYGGSGGGIYFAAGSGNPSLTLTNSSVSGNSAWQSGGGIFCCDDAFGDLEGSSVTISNSTISANSANESGGGALLFGKDLTASIDGTTIDGNIVGADGGGLWVGTDGGAGSLSITNSVIDDNTTGTNGGLGSGGGMSANDIDVVIADTTISNNTAEAGGGGLRFSGNNTHVTVRRCAITDNSDGGIFASYGMLALSNSTISGNYSSENYVGPNDAVSMEAGSVNNCTILDDVSALSSFGSVSLSNSIVTGGCSGVVSAGHNIDGDGYCILDLGPGDLSLSGDIGLAPLGSYGGPSLTYALCTATGVPHPSCMAPSPALDAGDPATPGSGGSACEATDQRGVNRPVGARCDIGAYETAGGSVCGDGTVDSLEECDDGNLVSGDGCEFDCSLTPYALRTGRRLVVRDKGGDPSKRRIAILSRDPAISAPPVGSVGDPRNGGAHLTLARGIAEIDQIDLPQSGWRGLGNPSGVKGYRYADRNRLLGPCKSAVLKNGLLKATCAGAQIDFSLDEPSQGALTVAFAPGNLGVRSCLYFGGDVRKDTQAAPGVLGSFKARNATAPVSCPLP